MPGPLKAQLRNVDRPAKQFFTELETSFLPSLAQGNGNRAASSIDRLSSVYGAHRREIDRLVQQTQAYQKQTQASSEAQVSFAFFSMIIAGVVMALVLGYANLLLSRFAIKPLNMLADTMRRMANGDLEARAEITKPVAEISSMMSALEVFRDTSKATATSEQKQALVVRELTAGLEALAAKNLAYRIETPFPDEYEPLRIGFNSSAEELQNVVAQTIESSKNVLNGAGEIRSASDDLALRTEQQAANLEQSASAMREVTAMVKQTAANAAAVGVAISQAHASAIEGGKVVSRANSAMGTLQQSANQINSIIDLIDGIAFQTNLLALNAGVEAARAGEAGKGFAVVANEVRALAQRSASAAQDIKVLIQTANQSVSQGVGLVDETGSMLLQISDQVAAVNERISEITQSTQNQAHQLQQVNHSVGEMDKMTQQNAAMVEQSNAAARSLAEEATELATLVQKFRIATVSLSPKTGARQPRLHAVGFG